MRQAARQTPPPPRSFWPFFWRYAFLRVGLTVAAMCFALEFLRSLVDDGYAPWKVAIILRDCIAAAAVGIVLGLRAWIEQERRQIDSCQRGADG